MEEKAFQMSASIVVTRFQRSVKDVTSEPEGRHPRCVLLRPFWMIQNGSRSSYWRGSQVMPPVLAHGSGNQHTQNRLGYLIQLSNAHTRCYIQHRTRRQLLFLGPHHMRSLCVLRHPRSSPVHYVRHNTYSRKFSDVYSNTSITRP